jgi:hypothetical protein
MHCNGADSPPESQIEIIMKRIALILLGASLMLAPAVEAKSRHDRHHHHGHYYEGSRYRYYSAPPWTVRRHWHHGRVYTYNDHRYHWRDGAWVIYSPVGRVVVYR